MARRRKGFFRSLTRFLKLSMGVSLLMSFGFGAYILKLPLAFEQQNVVEKEALVVLTGGRGRVEAALHQIEIGFSGPVLISGVHPSVTKDILLEGRTFTPEQTAQIELDYVAQTTRQNALVVQEWARQKGVMDVGVVTSHYHMPRSRWLFSLFAPSLTMVPLAVVPGAVAMSVLVKEYLKLLVAPLLP